MNNIIKLISKLIRPDELFIPETKDLKNLVVMITGANRGIGLSLAKLLLKNSAKLILVSKNSENLKSLLKDQKSDNYMLHQIDATNESEIKNAIKDGAKKFGKIDVLINCIGKFSFSPLETTELSEFNNIIQTNLNTLFLTCKEVIPIMKKNKDGLIINLGSHISHNTNLKPNKVLYATSKYAVEGFSCALNKELKEFNIRVTCLMPGTINTFISVKNPEYLSPYRVAEIILTIIKFNDVDFESIIFKSKYQNL